jgi:hypothetical protein
MQAKYEKHDEMMREKFPTEHVEIFRDLVLAILALEDAVEERERVRWNENDRDNSDPTYEELDAEVHAAYNGITEAAIDLTVKGRLGSYMAARLRERREALAS